MYLASGLVALHEMPPPLVLLLAQHETSEKNDRVIAFIRRITVTNERNPTVLGDLC